MPDRLLLPNLAELAARLSSPGEIGFFADCDGTLSEIVERPELAGVSPEIKKALNRLNRLYALVAVVSGRRAAEIEALLDRADLIYIGNHGLEERRRRRSRELPGLREAARRINAAKVEIIRSWPAASGIELEDKKFSLALHYRRSPVPDIGERLTALALSVAGEYGLRVYRGRRVVEVRPPAANKGRAVLALAAEFNLRQIIYIGDDRTDVDVFYALTASADFRGPRSLKIAVVGSETPQELRDGADYVLHSVSEVGKFIDWLVHTAETKISGAPRQAVD